MRHASSPLVTGAMLMLFLMTVWVLIRVPHEPSVSPATASSLGTTIANGVVTGPRSDADDSREIRELINDVDHHIQSIHQRVLERNNLWNMKMDRRVLPAQFFEKLRDEFIESPKDSQHSSEQTMTYDASHSLSIPADQLRRSNPHHVAEVEQFTKDDTIFVSVAAFRDVECGPTVESMYTQARYPERIFSGIVDQLAVTDSQCIPASFRECQRSRTPRSADAFCAMDNLRFRQIRPEAASGPTFGRYIAYMMYQGEKYFMMIDSHNRFVKQWDTRLLFMYLQLPTKGILSHYPQGYDPGFVLESNKLMMWMCYAHFYAANVVGIVRNGAKYMSNQQIRPLLQPFTGAGFVFGNAEFVFDVPFDPHLDFLFDGEEILYTVRLWTHGWDSYMPAHDIMYHFYGRPKAPKVFTSDGWWQSRKKISERRVMHLLNMPKANSTELAVQPNDPNEDPRIYRELDVYGMGTERRVEDFWPFAHVNPVNRTSDRGFCDSRAS